jgi:hypothetical protein
MILKNSYLKYFKNELNFTQKRYSHKENQDTYKNTITNSQNIKEKVDSQNIKEKVEKAERSHWEILDELIEKYFKH